MVQPCSVDVRMDRYFRLFDNHKYPVIDPSHDQPDLTRLVEVDPDEAFVLHPGEFVLGSIFETVTLPDDVAARVEGKSSLGRLGLLTHATAGFIDPGFSGHVTLELSNVATLPIKLWPGMKIGQLCFFRLTSPAENPYGSAAYGSRYQGQRGPTASRVFQSFHRDRRLRAQAGAIRGTRGYGPRARPVCRVPGSPRDGTTEETPDDHRTTPALRWTAAPDDAKAVVLVLHGGASRSTEPAARWTGLAVSGSPVRQRRSQGRRRRGRRRPATSACAAGTAPARGRGRCGLALDELRGSTPACRSGWSATRSVAASPSTSATRLASGHRRARALGRADRDPATGGRHTRALLLHGTRDRMTSPLGGEPADGDVTARARCRRGIRGHPR